MVQPGAGAPQRRLLTTLRTERENQGLSQSQVAQALGWAVAKVARIEQGRSNVSLQDLRALLALYRISEHAQIERLLVQQAEADRGRRQSLGRDSGVTPEALQLFASLGDAGSIRWFELNLIPGLLQTEAYARAVIKDLAPVDDTPESIEQRLRLRLEVQAILGRPDAPTIHAIVDEAALRRQVGGRQIMLDQLAHLRELSRRPNITLQVLPFAVGTHDGMDGPFILLEFRDPTQAPLLYREGPGTDALHRDDPRRTDTYRARFESLAACAAPTAWVDRLLDDLMAPLQRDTVLSGVA